MIRAAASPIRWALFAVRPLLRWYRGRVVLLGDAAHGMLPHHGQGANTSIEDAFALAALLADARPTTSSRRFAALPGAAPRPHPQDPAELVGDQRPAPPARRARGAGRAPAGPPGAALDLAVQAASRPAPDLAHLEIVRICSVAAQPGREEHPAIRRVLAPCPCGGVRGRRRRGRRPCPGTTQQGAHPTRRPWAGGRLDHFGHRRAIPGRRGHRHLIRDVDDGASGSQIRGGVSKTTRKKLTASPLPPMVTCRRLRVRAHPELDGLQGPSKQASQHDDSRKAGWCLSRGPSVAGLADRGAHPTVSTRRRASACSVRPLANSSTAKRTCRRSRVDSRQPRCTFSTPKAV